MPSRRPRGSHPGHGSTAVKLAAHRTRAETNGPDLTRAIAGDRDGRTAPQQGSPGGGLSGVGILPGGGETAATSGKGERLAAGVLGKLPARIARGLSPIAARTDSRPEPAASTPLYLSHCAFLC